MGFHCWSPNKADVNSVNARGQSPLHFSTKAGLVDVSLWFSDRVSVSVLHLRDDFGATAVYNARAAGLPKKLVHKLEKDLAKSVDTPRQVAHADAHGNPPRVNAN